MQSVMNSIVQFFNTASSYFYNLYLECYYAPYIPTSVANIFYSFSTLFSNIAWYLSDLFSQMLTKFNEILNWSTIQSYILGWLPNLDDINYWFTNWISNVTSIITSWWNTTQLTVQGWIETAKSFLQSQINSLNTWLTSLQAAWDAFKGKIPSIDTIISWFTNWWANILAQIIAWGALTALQIQSLIDSAFTLRNDYWAGWQDWRLAVIEFFTNPFDWIKTHIFEPIVDDFNRGFDRGLKG